MQRLGLDVPDSVRNVCLKEATYKNLNNGLTHILHTKKAVLGRVSTLLRKAMQPHIDELDKTLQPGLTALTWFVLLIIGRVLILIFICKQTITS